MSGVTARTLRHYDEVGLLAPAWVEAGGRRHYGQEQLLRLQQILLLRELGFGLREIGRILAEQVDELEALRAHRHRLLAERGQRERTALMIRLAERLAAGTPADAPPVQAEVHVQYEAMARIQPVGAEQWRAIADSCVQDEQWRAAYEAITPGLAAYQRDAMLAYADTHLR